MSSEQSSSVGAHQTSHTSDTSDHDIPVVAFLGPSGTCTEMAMLEFAGHGWCDTPPQGTRTGLLGQKAVAWKPPSPSPHAATA